MKISFLQGLGFGVDTQITGKNVGDLFSGATRVLLKCVLVII